MVKYAEVLLIAIPAFVALIVIEKLYGWIVGNDYTPWPDAISSMSSGITNVLKDVLGIWVVLLGYGWMLDHLAIFHISSDLLVITISFIIVDFSYYWIHRWQHKINILWNEHIIHHSSEEFNLACALRQTISVFVKWQVLLFFPAAILGVPELVMATVVPIHLFLQFWYHTRHIKKLGLLEYFLVTPSHHRVHHAINPDYIDKNFSAIFIIWDRMFGTFQEEKEGIETVYGVSRPVKTWNPFKINFQHLWVLIKDAYYSKSIKAILTIWFKSTGWRPKRSEEAYAIEKIDDPQHQSKYDTKMSPMFQLWSGMQLIFNLFLTILLFLNLRYMENDEMLAMGALVFIGIYNFTDLMDLNRFNWMLEILRIVVLIVFFNYHLLDFLTTEIVVFILIWMIISLFISVLSRIKIGIFETTSSI